MKINYECGSEVVSKNFNGLKLELNMSKKQDVLKEIERLNKNRTMIHETDTESTIDLLDKCAKKWLDREYSRRSAEILSKITNQSVQLIEYEMQNNMRMLLKENIEKTIEEELGDLNIMDKWIKTSYGYAHRQPRGLIFHNISGNAFVVVIMSIAMGLLSKSVNLVKVSGDEPYFSYAFYKSLCEIDSTVKDRLSIVYFDSKEENIYENIVSKSDCVIHWGGERSSEIMANLCSKYNKHIIMHGAKISFEVIDRAEDILKCTNAIAKDIVCWEQKACLSPRIVFVNENINLEEFSQKLSDNLREMTNTVPKLYLNAWNSIKTIQDRQYCMIKHSLREDNAKLYSSYNADYTVILTKDMPDKEDINRCFYRFVFVCPYSNDNEVYKYVKENIADYLQTMGYSGDNQEFIEKMTLLGVSAVTRPGYMTLHYPGTSHDGIHNLYDMTLLVSRQV
ncbi:MULTISPECIES: acyl-CoA reductase [Clostridium]|uniref:acyl-CoA reductase n=1 Tax=Clostridium TaxID=1485 RepID=UPI00069DA547|nr:acyl-CoA reductase [Clostridium sp. DMHC 10]KOF55937.1 acyl-CoA reductase [Clostridium sp. DMHC 10]MCD2345331.1 acyl-CoA reductase [Clostridium guangxiense]